MIPRMRLWRFEEGLEATKLRFCRRPFRMYQRYAETKGWQLAVSSVSEGAAGGFKEIIFSLTGEGVYGIT